VREERWGDVDPAAGGVEEAEAEAEVEEGMAEAEERRRISSCTRLRGRVMRRRWSRCASPTLSPSTPEIASPAPHSIWRHGLDILRL